MQALGITLGAMLGVLSVGIAQASETFVPEVLTVEKAIKPGANVFVRKATVRAGRGGTGPNGTNGAPGSVGSTR